MCFWGSFGKFRVQSLYKKALKTLKPKKNLKNLNLLFKNIGFSSAAMDTA